MDSPIRDLLKRLEHLTQDRSFPFLSDSAQGHTNLPRILVSAMPAHHERIRADRVSAKNACQLREWRNKYIRATEAFIGAVGDEVMSEVTPKDARAYRGHWDKKRRSYGLTTQYVNKQINHMSQLVDAFYKDAGFFRRTTPTPLLASLWRNMGSNCVSRRVAS